MHEKYTTTEIQFDIAIQRIEKHVLTQRIQQCTEWPTQKTNTKEFILINCFVNVETKSIKMCRLKFRL